MSFDDWYAKAYPLSQDMQNPEHHRMRRVAAAAWNDSRQMALAAVFLRYNALRKRVFELPRQPEIRRAVNEFLTELSEMT